MPRTESPLTTLEVFKPKSGGPHILKLETDIMCIFSYKIFSYAHVILYWINIHISKKLDVNEKPVPLQVSIKGINNHHIMYINIDHIEMLV